MNNRSLPNVEHDYRFFVWFLTLVTTGMYIWAVIQSPDLLNRPGLLVIGTLLLAVNITLHWFTNQICASTRLLVGYIVIQGLLAFAISLILDMLFMNYALFLGLIGECIGMLRFSRGGLLGIAYYLVLSLAAFILLSTPAEAVWWLAGTVPALVFVGIYVTMYNRQTEANERARELLAELEQANRQLSEYAGQVEDLTIAAERQRMARELHDTLSQGLAGLILQLEAADAHLAQDHPEKARQIVQQTMQKARVTLGEARQVIDNLRGPAAPSLEATLRQALEHFQSAAEVECALDLNLPDEISPLQREAIARILSEALTNIRRHANATHVWVKVCGDQNGTQLEIRDDGIGFDPSSTPPGHYGLIGIRERARLAGGQLTIHSQPGTGSQLLVHFSNSEQNHDLTDTNPDRG